MMFLIHILKSIQLKKVSLQEFANLLYIIHVSRGVEISMAGSIVSQLMYTIHQDITATLYFLPNTFISFLLPLAWSALVMVPIIFPNPPDEVLLSSSVKDQSGSILFNHSQDGIFPIYSFCTLLMKAMLKILCIDTLISSQFQPFRPSYKFS